MKIISKVLLLTLVTFAFSISVFSQCKSFTKKKCMPQVLPYIHNGQLNSINIFPGESASLTVPFYSGQDYRIVVCGHKILGDVYFEVRNSDEELIYSSKGKSSTWDFNVASSQELLIDVIAPPDESGDSEEGMAQSGCMALLVAFRQ
ncbi:MAG: hypothetical protein COA57_00800 [Flavobacteriales bacterium]|nr:MAG: hypothetical protein COA57_00800 [Flavobacteriales bacterium]